MKQNYVRKRIYLDYAAATPVRPEVLLAMRPYFSAKFANPSSVHKEGEEAARALEKARTSVAASLGARASQIIFTSGGTESNNLAILGSARATGGKIDSFRGQHFIASEIEHSSILEPLSFLGNSGAEIDYLKVDRLGRVNPIKLREKMKKNTVLVSVALANNEIGAIQPIKEIAREIRRFKKECGSYPYPLFHTDAGQMPLYADVDVSKLGADLLSVDGGKIYGPKGSGLLFFANEKFLKGITFGGGQERGLRAGTENVPAVIGLAKALEIAKRDETAESRRLSLLRDYFLKRIKKELKEISINGAEEGRIANNVNVFVPRADSEFLIIKLDYAGIAASSGSACLAGSGELSPTVKAIRPNEVGGSARFSMGIDTGKREIDFTIKALKKIVSELSATNLSR